MDTICNFVSFIIPMAIFVTWLIVGYASLTLLNSNRDVLQNLLLAPPVGFAVTILLVFELNRLGLPVGKFATILTAFLFILSSALLFFKKTPLNLKNYSPFLLLFLLALCVVGFPLLKYGFNWLSFGNDDMTNYALGAARFVRHGFYDIPDLNEFINKKDYSLTYWFWYVLNMMRPGSELMLAWLSGITHLNPVQIYMPLMLSYYLVIISVTGALVYSTQKNYVTTLVTCLMVSLSALTVLGVYYQLIAQVSGLCLLIAGLILTCRSFDETHKYSVIKESLLIGLVLSALCIVYQELFPFLILPAGIYFTTIFFRGWRPNKVFFQIIFGSLLVILIVMNIQLIAMVEFFWREYQITSSAAVMQTALFPYFLLPTGLANLWGFLGITFHKSFLYTNFAILAGIFLTLITFVFAVRLMVKKSSVPAIVTIVMLCLGLDFFRKKYGFGLFKLSMFIQPFLLSVLVISVFEVFSNKYLKNMFLGLIILGGCCGLLFYEKLAIARKPGSFIEIAYGSSNKLTEEYKKLISQVPDDSLVLSDEFNISIVKIQALESISKRFVPLTSPSNFLIGALSDDIYIFSKIHRGLFFGEKGRVIADIYSKKGFSWGEFNLFDHNNQKIHFLKNNYCEQNKTCDGYLISDNAIRSIFNRRYSLDDVSKDFSLKKLSDVKNHLVFIDSDLGKSYHSMIESNMDHLSLFNVENDYFYPGRSFQTIGRFLLMQVLNPSSKFRITVNFTNSLNNDGKNKLPNLVAIGDRRVVIPTMGSGSARVFSTSFSPQTISDIKLVALDMYSDDIKFNPKRKGLLNLYNSTISEDSRQITSYARDISLISENDYLDLIPPNHIEKFPNDLANNNLEYSGIYEDGWFSQDAFVVLRQPKHRSNLIVRGEVPNTNEDVVKSTLKVLLDGKVVTDKQLLAGVFQLSIPIESNSKSHRIELHFNKSQKLQGADKRPVGAKINFIGFV